MNKNKIKQQLNEKNKRPKKMFNYNKANKLENEEDKLENKKDIVDNKGSKLKNKYIKL